MKKNLRHLRNLRDLKNVPRKICVYLWNLWDKIFIGFHGWIGGYSCLSDYSRICADIWPLANGSRQIVLLLFFVPQISQISTDFLWNLWWIALSNPRGYLQRPNRSPPRKSVSNRFSRKPPNKFRVIRWIKICVICEICVTKNPTQIFLFVYNSVLFDLIY